MTLVGTFSEHHTTPAPGEDIERFSPGKRGETHYDQLLDIATYFVGENGSRGLKMGSSVVCMTVETDDEIGAKTWNFILPSPEDPPVDVISQRIGATLTEFDGDHSLYADHATLLYSHTSTRARLEDVRPLDGADMVQLGLAQEALEDWLLEDRPLPPVVPTSEVS